ncbi:YjgF-like protein [Pyrenochaeta sp. DS3sAY3a]|nr:YjgF-like protein [Pyrenochaeta sp. DS3sAY3a]
MSEVKNFNPANHNTFSPTYSHISRVPISATHSIVSFAGQIGHDSATNSIPPTLGEQCSLAFANVDKCLEAAGATKKDIIQVRQYVVGLLKRGEGGRGQDPERAKRYLEWMGDLRPASTLLGVEALANEDLVYEIEVVCVVRNQQ